MYFVYLRIGVLRNLTGLNKTSCSLYSFNQLVITTERMGFVCSSNAPVANSESR